MYWKWHNAVQPEVRLLVDSHMHFFVDLYKYLEVNL